MKAARFVILLALAVAFGTPGLLAQDDPSGQFFAAYQEYQRAERLEREGRNDDAIAKFRFVAAQLAQIKSQHADWQPLVVDFRLRKTQEAVLRLEGSLASPTLGPPPDLASTESEDDALPPLQPARRDAPAQSGPTISIAPPSDSGPSEPPAGPTDIVLREAPAGGLEQLRRQLDMEKKRNKELQDQIQRGEAEFNSVSMELEKTKVTVVDLTTQLRNLEDSGAPAADGEAPKEELDRLSGKAKELEETLAASDEEKKQLTERVTESERQIEDLTAKVSAAQEEAEKVKADLAGVQGEIDAAKAEADQAKARAGELESERDQARQETETVRGEVQTLTARVTELEEERTQLIAARDSAQQEAAEAKTALEKSADLIEANKQLEQKLAEAAERISGMESDAAEKTELIASLNTDLEKVREELTGAQAKLQEDRERFDKLQAVNDQLLKEYDQVTGALAAVKLGEVSAADAKLVQQENEVLRGIIMRQIKEQARREQAFRLAQEEMERLEIRSDTLNDKINELAKPTLELTAAEQEMLKRPVVTLLDTDSTTMTASIEVLKPQTDPTVGPGTDAATESAPAADGTSAAPDEAAPTETAAAAPSESASPEPPAPREAETAALVAEAREAFVNGNFSKAEELYQKFVEQQPDNVVALANLGVAQFRQGKLTAAQLALERAIKADPKDAFSLTTLGAVMIEQDRIDDAIGYLERANEAQADDPITLNYLGVASSQVGQFGKAEQSLRRAITVKPEYAEAHFNLAVIYATAKPPSIALAKRHYEKALELGSSPDQRLATMLQSAPGS
jgi:Tfp pilus assembly protein PilF/outer membrane murein-binding lipoprotein Lpp